MAKKTLESDWKAYKRIIPSLRDRYLQRKNQELVAILSNDGRTPTENFWQAKGSMDEQVQILHQCLDGHSRSKMWMSMLMMHSYGLIQDQDLDEFSELLKQDILSCSKAASNGV
jgi:hypothetical protein